MLLPSVLRCLCIGRLRLYEGLMSQPGKTEPIASPEPQQLLETPQLADALESDRFKRFLDHIPFAVVVADGAARLPRA